MPRGGSRKLGRRLLGAVARGAEPVEVDGLAALELDAVDDADHAVGSVLDARYLEDADSFAAVDRDGHLVDAARGPPAGGLPARLPAPVVAAWSAAPAASRTSRSLSAAPPRGVADRALPGCSPAKRERSQERRVL
jgi:hypothetical protein